MGTNMESLAKAVVCAFAFLELSGDDVVDPDSAVSAMESMSAELQTCTDEEKAALRKVIVAELHAQQARSADGSVIEFYRDLMLSIGLEDDADA